MEESFLSRLRFNNDEKHIPYKRPHKNRQSSILEKTLEERKDSLRTNKLKRKNGKFL